MENQEHGNYEYLDSSVIPSLFLAYVGGLSNVRYRNEQNDTEVIQVMQTFAEHTSECKVALAQRDSDQIGELMNKNFNLRRKIFGAPVIGKKTGIEHNM